MPTPVQSCLYVIPGFLLLESVDSLKLHAEKKEKKKKESQAKLYVDIPGGRDYTFLLILNVFCDPNMIRR